MQEITPFQVTIEAQNIAQVADEYARQRVFMDYQAKIAENTRIRHLADLRLFSSYLQQAGINVSADQLYSNPESWSIISYGLVKGFVQWHIQNEYAMSSCNARLYTIRRYCKLAQACGTISVEKLESIKSIEGYDHKAARNIDRAREEKRRGHKKAQSTRLTNEQVTRLKKQHPETQQGYKDAFMMCLLLDHGLRCGEVGGIEKLTTASIDLVRGTITFYREKVDRWQTHNLTKDTLEAARKYLTTIPEQGPLFYGYQGKAMSQRAINHRVGVLGKAAGVQGLLSPHDCRHDWASRAARKKTPVSALKAAGGWRSPTTALKYVLESEIANDGVVLD